MLWSSMILFAPDDFGASFHCCTHQRSETLSVTLVNVSTSVDKGLGIFQRSAMTRGHQRRPSVTVG